MWSFSTNKAPLLLEEEGMPLCVAFKNHSSAHPSMTCFAPSQRRGDLPDGSLQGTHIIYSHTKGKAI